MLFLKHSKLTKLLNMTYKNGVSLRGCSHLSTLSQISKCILFLIPLPPSQKCTTKNVDFIVKTLYSQ